MKHTFLPVYMLFAVLALAVSSCIEDGFTTSPADQPSFSADTLRLGTVFTDEVSPTSSMVVYNPHSKGINISHIALSGDGANYFRVNVDGTSGTSFADMEIRSRDSIYVMVEARLPENGSTRPVTVEASLDFTTNGVTRSVILSADGQNVVRMRAVTLDADRRFTADVPYQIYDSLVVPEGVTMTVDPGANLLFHDKAMLVVRGTLVTEGTPKQRVTMTGDRVGTLVGSLDFDIMSRQWTGVFFTSSSTGNRLIHTDIKNTVQGVTVVGHGDAADGAAPQLDLLNCRLRNSAYNVLDAYHADIRAIGCEFAEGGGGLVALQGGRAVMNHCTFANYYLYAVIDGPALAFSHISADEWTGADDGSGLPYLKADISNSIIYGLGTTFSHGDLTDTDVYLRRCLIKGEGTDDDHFISILWDEDPLYYTVRNDYFFDYRLQPESPAIGAADPALTLPEAAADGYGLLRGAAPDLGAYVYTEPEK